MTTWDRFTKPETSLEVRAKIAKPFYVRSFCDDPNGTVYGTKAPVCKLTLTPTTQFNNTNIAWDISDSASATGTINTFDITWGGTTDIGNLSAQDWSTDPLTGNVQFTTAGTYTVTATVTDTLGNKSAPCEIEVEIVASTTTDRLYVGTTDAGCFVVTASGVTQSIGSLSGDDLKFRSLRLHPAYKNLPSTQHHLWAATKNGVAYSFDGATTWSTISKATLGTPTNDAGDGPAPATADLDQIDIAFDPQNKDAIYLLRTTATRAWVYYSIDYGATWSNAQLSYKPALTATTPENWSGGNVVGLTVDVIAIDSDYVAIAYSDATDGFKAKCVVVDISAGSPVTVGTPTTLDTNTCGYTKIVRTGTNAAVMTWTSDDAVNIKVRAAALSFSGTTISAGSVLDVDSATSGNIFNGFGLAAVSTTRVQVAYAASSDGLGHAVNILKSGLATSLGTAIDLLDDYTNFAGAGLGTYGVFAHEHDSGGGGTGHIAVVSSTEYKNDITSKNIGDINDSYGADAVEIDNNRMAVIWQSGIEIVKRAGASISERDATTISAGGAPVGIDLMDSDVLIYVNNNTAETATIVSDVASLDGNSVTYNGTGNAQYAQIAATATNQAVAVFRRSTDSLGYLSIITQPFDFDITHSNSGIPGAIKI